MSDFREVIKHSGNYLIANLATRALAFISIPVYTRLLSTKDYGIISVFLAVAGILNSLLALSFDSSISRYYFDKTSDIDFKKFVGTTLIASCIVMLFTSNVIIVYANQIAEWLELPVKVVYLLVPMVVINIIGLLFTQIYQPQKLSRPIAVSSLFRVYLGFACSIGLILMFNSEKYFGQILGQILAGVIMLFYWCRKISPYAVLYFNSNHFKYIVNYSIPLIPYALSGVIIEQFGKLFIASNNGVSQAGFYTLAVSIASLTGIITEITHQAWFPYYMEYMNSRNYSRHDRELVRIFKISLLAAMFFSCFGKEIGLLLARKEFTSALYLIPILTVGYVCHQFSYAYMRNISYVLKTSYMSVIVISSGCINVLLNSVLIVRIGIIGSAFSFVVSYFIMAILSWYISTYVLKVRGIPFLQLLYPLLILFLFFIPLYFILQVPDIWYALGLKILLLSGLAYTLFRQDKQIILSFLCSYYNKLRG